METIRFFKQVQNNVLGQIGALAGPPILFLVCSVNEFGLSLGLKLKPKLDEKGNWMFLCFAHILIGKTIHLVYIALMQSSHLLEEKTWVIVFPDPPYNMGSKKPKQIILALYKFVYTIGVRVFGVHFSLYVSVHETIAQKVIFRVMIIMII